MNNQTDDSETNRMSNDKKLISKESQTHLDSDEMEKLIDSRRKPSQLVQSNVDTNLRLI